MVRENPTWGEERVAAELWVKLRDPGIAPDGAGVLAAKH